MHWKQPQVSPCTHWTIVEEDKKVGEGGGTEKCLVAAQSRATGWKQQLYMWTWKTCTQKVTLGNTKTEHLSGPGVFWGAKLAMAMLSGGARWREVGHPDGGGAGVWVLCTGCGFWGDIYPGVWGDHWLGSVHRSYGGMFIGSLCESGMSTVMTKAIQEWKLKDNHYDSKT